jgi:hypothetical protein
LTSQTFSKVLRTLVISGMLPLCAASHSPAGSPALDEVDFRRDVLPILSENCFSCHGFAEDARQAGLRLDVSEGALADADSGSAAIVPNRPEESEMWRRVSADDPDIRMPPPETEKRLTEPQREVLYRWIEQGAKYRKHWAFEAPIASVEHGGAEHPIDRFIQSRLAREGLPPSPRADDATLLRRISLDLIGLPPTLDELDRFTLEARANRDLAISKAVDRLLANPHYGERWGRWWLDQARYADSNGYSIDAPREIWKFRDWAVDALNMDMPFDQFTIEQLAGDLLPNATESQKVATGFHRNTQINQEGGIDTEQFRVDSVFDRVATTGTVWLGLTIGCAQCHDHKFDPVSQREYYRLFAFFNNQEEPTLKVQSETVASASLAAEFEAAIKEIDDYIAARAADYDAWESKLTADEIEKMSESFQVILKLEKFQRSPEQMREVFNIEVGKVDSDFQTIKRKVDKLDAEVNGVATTLVMREREVPRRSTVLMKGDFTRPAEEVLPGTPSILHALEVKGTYANRLDLARWITSPKNPLTARVIVNRVWQVYFGRGLVETENDFGTLGSPPTHPELLDWLAVEFQNRGWSLKELHRLIVTSHTYQQCSDRREDLDKVDPQNYLLGRQTRLRLEAEIIRDLCLSVGGLLSTKFGGPPVYPPIPEGVMNRGQVNRPWEVSAGEDRYRRAIYTFVFRATPPPSLNVFDAPDGFSPCTRRSRSNTPLQALTLLNDEAFVEFANSLQSRIERDGLENAFRAATGRVPQPEELGILTHLSTHSAARVLLNLDETITRN